MRPIKFFNFALPYETYQELKRISNETGQSVAEIVREGINYVLKNKNYKIRVTNEQRANS